MNAKVLQLVPSEDIGSISHWLDRRGATVTTTRFFDSIHLPNLAGIDYIIAMG